MTLRDKVKRIRPSEVDEGYDGGVCGCPSDYEFLIGHFNKNIGCTCSGCDFDCISCWSQEYIVDEENVNHPDHYQGKNECIDVMVAMFGKEAVKHFCMCNAYKYRFRANKKNGEEDIEKAEWYESKLIELGGIDDDR